MEQVEQLLSVKQMAEHFGVAEITIHRWKEQGMPHRRIGVAGRTIRFTLQEVNEWMDQRHKVDKTD